MTDRSCDPDFLIKTITEMAKDFTGKSVIVTGSNSGIGEAIAVLFAKRGAMVTLCGRDEERLQEALKKCQQAGGEAGEDTRYITVCGDVNDKEVREKIVDDTVKQFGRLDVLVCNHGIASKIFVIDQDTEENFDAVLNTNLKSVYFLIQKAIPHLEKVKGCIVSTSSISSMLAGLGPLSYAISKAAMDHMTRCLALALAPRGIRVNAINPTFVMTPILETMGPEVLKACQDVAKTHPLHGRASTVEEQAQAVAFLASDQASFITGMCLKVDGAMTLRGVPVNLNS